MLSRVWISARYFAVLWVICFFTYFTWEDEATWVRVALAVLLAPFPFALLLNRRVARWMAHQEALAWRYKRGRR
jgi:hypothetical protein